MPNTICPECGGKSNRHLKTCSRYKPVICSECGGKSGNHKPSCSKYKPRKQPKPCPECGVVKGHLKTCSHYKVTVCPECGSSRGHHSWCSHDKKCPECGYSLRSRTHAPTCSHYDKAKNDKREQAYRKTMEERYGITNAYFMPGHAEKMINAANKSNSTVHISKINREIANKLKECGVNNVSLEYKIGDHWYDIYCEHNGKELLIERNPSVSHNFDYDYMYVTGKSKVNKGGKPKRYHLDMSALTEQNGYELIHWFDHIDENKMYDLILSKLGLNKTVYYARNCEIKEVDPSRAMQFINDYHLLRLTRKCPINIGLYYEGTLLSVMAFDNLKDNVTNRKFCNGSVSRCYELVRYCNTNGCTVVGGAAKLHKYFIDNYKPLFIKTVSDYNLGNGTLYKNLGYSLAERPKPSCLWIQQGINRFINNNLVLNGVDRFLSRYVDNYFKVGIDEKDFIKRGGLEVYGKFPSNEEIMLHYGFLRIYDSGYKTWLMKIDN